MLTTKNKREHTLAYHLLTLPAVLLSGFVILLPAIQTIYVAFTEWNGVSATKTWVGLQNFKELATDWIFWRAVVNNFKWTVIFLTIPVSIAMIAAVLMVRYRIGFKSYQTIFLIPYLLAPTTQCHYLAVPFPV